MKPKIKKSKTENKSLESTVSKNVEYIKVRTHHSLERTGPLTQAYVSYTDKYVRARDYVLKGLGGLVLGNATILGSLKYVEENTLLTGLIALGASSIIYGGAKLRAYIKARSDGEIYMRPEGNPSRPSLIGLL